MCVKDFFTCWRPQVERDLSCPSMKKKGFLHEDLAKPPKPGNSKGEVISDGSHNPEKRSPDATSVINPPTVTDPGGYESSTTSKKNSTSSRAYGVMEGDRAADEEYEPNMPPKKIMSKRSEEVSSSNEEVILYGHSQAKDEGPEIIPPKRTSTDSSESSHMDGDEGHEPSPQASEVSDTNLAYREWLDRAQTARN